MNRISLAVRIFLPFVLLSSSVPGAWAATFRNTGRNRSGRSAAGRPRAVPAAQLSAALGAETSPTEVIVQVPRSLSARVDADLAFDFGLDRVEERLWEQSGRAGLPADWVGRFQARPLGSIALINTMVYAVPAERQAEFIADLRARGYDAQAGKVYRVPEPVLIEPGLVAEIGLREMAKLIGADKLQAEIERVIGPPAPGVAANLRIPWALMDTYMQSDSHPYLKGRFLKEIAGAPDGQYHGFHVGGITIGSDRYNYEGHGLNIFPKGSATEGDILLKLNMAVSELGVITTGNSWGDRQGQVSDRFMPGQTGGDKIGTLMEKQALELGVHHSISAGNSGSRPNTTGGPAIGTAQVGLELHGKKIGLLDRMQAIAAGDANRVIATFSSRGKWSPWITRNNADGRLNDYPRRPARTAIGVQVIAPLPPGSGRHIDELGGPGGPLSGTSMSRPQDHGAKMLLARALLVLLGDYIPASSDPRAQLALVLDIAEWAMAQSAQKHNEEADYEIKYGNGFIDVWRAFELAAATMKASAPASLLRMARASAYGEQLIRQLVFTSEGVRLRGAR
ncbi:MAG: hypothetical protein HY549_05560 [Elusimicrobia bacterium]|nr:hypothetical protein [Elusimicrobiota bacterium]